MDGWNINYRNIRASNPLRWPDNDMIRLVSHANVLGTAHILDFGCGEGRNTRFLLEKFPGSRITCVDKSPAALEILRRLYGVEIEAKLTDGIEITQGPFDLALVWGVTHYISDVSSFLQNLRKELRTSGSLVISFQGEMDSRPRMAKLSQLFTQGEATELLSASKFNVLESGCSLGHSFTLNRVWHTYWFRTVAI